MGAENEAPEAEDLPLSVNGNTTAHQPAPKAVETDLDDLDDFGLHRRPASKPPANHIDGSDEEDSDTFHDAEDNSNTLEDNGNLGSVRQLKPQIGKGSALTQSSKDPDIAENPSQSSVAPTHALEQLHDGQHAEQKTLTHNPRSNTVDPAENSKPLPQPAVEQSHSTPLEIRHSPENDKSTYSPTKEPQDEMSPTKRHERRSRGPVVSEWSHQRLAPQANESDESDEGDDWKAMPALAEFDIYDDDDKLVARGTPIENVDEATYGGLGGAGKGYTRVQLDEDAQSATSMDEDTGYLFKQAESQDVIDEDEQRDALTQLEATKDLLTEGQRIAYVGVTKLAIYGMMKELQDIQGTKATKKELTKAVESMEKWGQQMMVRIYGHMDIESAEQVMIEQLAEHGVQPADLVPPLMQSSRIKNPMADDATQSQCGHSNSKRRDYGGSNEQQSKSSSMIPEPEGPSLKEGKDGQEVPDVQTPSQMPITANIDLDLRWTVLCDLFLVLISDSIYDARSRCLLERVASAMEINWVQICRFEKRVMEALEMQEETATENWDEADHMENRRKMGLKRKYMVMGLATVGGGLVIGLSAGLLAPVIGAGLAAGFTTIGVTGTAGFLGGVGGAALITSAATAAGGTIAVRASHRRTGAVQTFEYRPLHNNKRVNLILTISGWMNGKVDDVRLPYSTVDPIMGDIYSLLWEPEMLQSMGDTINILATEALTQTVQQVLGSTILVALMASLQLPIVLTKLSYLIDNPWTVSLDRANSGGLILADSLIDRHLGNRPITLIGFSLGSRLIFSCLKELANRGAYGIVQNVYLFGSPIVAKRDEYLRARSVVSGRFVNGYASNDWILGYLFRATSGGIMRVAGLGPVEDIPGLENLDVTSIVNGHMAYRAAMPKLLREVGWEVESDEFTEIEDPDPENHQKRQRELIREIDEARKEAEAKPEKKRFGFFKRGRLAEKKGWETYGGLEKNGHKRGSSESLGAAGTEGGVLFDIDAIRRELESEMIEVRELDSTLPPMQISINGTVDGGGRKSPYSTLRQTKSSDPSMGSEIRAQALLSQQSLDPGEIAKMKLPPRPDEIDAEHHTREDDKGEPKPSTMIVEPDHDFTMPRELKSTLPPLTLTPPLTQSSGDVTPSSTMSRPELKSHATMPAFESNAVGVGSSALPTTASFAAMNLDHNAWADDDENFGKEGEMQMTFE